MLSSSLRYFLGSMFIADPLSIWNVTGLSFIIILQTSLLVSFVLFLHTEFTTSVVLIAKDSAPPIIAHHISNSNSNTLTYIYVFLKL